MYVEKLEEAGYGAALRGLYLSYSKSGTDLDKLAHTLAVKGGGHSKFLESIQTWWKIAAPRYWWQQMATYRHSTTQSESTMHTLMKRNLVQADFEYSLPVSILDYLNILIDQGDFERLKNDLPEGFVQTRVVSVNYATLRNILGQRRHHKLNEWRNFCQLVPDQVDHPALLRFEA